MSIIWPSIRSAYARILLASVLTAAGIVPLIGHAAQQPPPPSATPEEVQTYEAFRAWITMQPVDVQKADDEVVFERYTAVLRAQGKSERDAAATIASLKAIGDRAEIERWNRILTAPKPAFNTSPNAFLVSGDTVVVEGFHRDATKTRSIGGGVVFDTNELLQLFAPLRVVRYEDTDAVGDFGQVDTRVVRIAAVKPQ